MFFVGSRRGDADDDVQQQAVEVLRAAFPDSEFVQSMSKVALLRYVRARSSVEESIGILKTTVVR